MTLPFEYSLKKHKSTKNLKIKIDSNGAVVVVSPPFIPKFLIEKFVSKHQDWVIEHSKIQLRQPKFNTPEFVYIFGKKYYKKLEFSLKKQIGMYTQGENLIFNPITEPKIETKADKIKWDKKFQEKLEIFLKNTAKHYIISRTFKIAEKMGLKFNKITLRKQKTRWGSCSNQKNLNFNWQLIYFDTQIIDYVIIHELAHLVHMNHSQKFWNLVEKFDPEYKKRVGWLKRNGLNVG
jgi:predicted metal-dependent hydrolase